MLEDGALKAIELHRVQLAGGQSVPQVCRELGVAEQTSSRWREEYGGGRTDQAKRLVDLEWENERLERLLAEAESDEAILREARAGNSRDVGCHCRPCFGWGA